MSNPSQEKIKIMIVDASVDYGAIIKQSIEDKQDFDVPHPFVDAQEALQALPETKPDVVLFDLILSKMDGIAFLEKALQITGSKTKYIAISTLANDSTVRHVTRLGAAYYMVKPINIDDLCDRIRMLCADRLKSGAVRAVLTNGTDEDLEGQVTAAILEIGIPAHVKGYYYVRSAIMMAIDSPDAINAVTKIIYPTIAKIYNTSASRVERAIRHAIEVAWDRGNVDTLNSVFGYSISSSRGKPTNSEFIAMLADRLRLRNKKNPTPKVQVPTLL